jgi:hypothetical protein
MDTGVQWVIDSRCRTCLLEERGIAGGISEIVMKMNVGLVRRIAEISVQ